MFFLFILNSFSQDIPKSVYAPEENGYVYADYPDVFGGFGNEGFTVELWFYLIDFPKDMQEKWIMIDKPRSYIIYIVGKRPVLPENVACEMYYMTYSAGGSDLGGSASYISNDQINTWIHFAFMIRGTGPVEHAAFKNGVNIGRGGHGSMFGFFASDDPLFIGGREGHKSIKGWIDEIRISKGCRYGNDFKPERRFEIDKNTLALWHFDEGNDSNFYKDSSGNGYTLWASGTTAVDSKSTSATTWGRLKR